MMLTQEILNNWKTDISGNLQDISSLKDTSFPAWTIKLDESYGVAIPYSNHEEVNETFANARIRSSYVSVDSGERKRVLLLSTNSSSIMNPFSSFCEAFINPGEDGMIRKAIEDSPIDWWRDWKELLGNKNIDARIYDTLGELCALKYAVQNNEEPCWNGPDGSSYDIETAERFLEVKSSVVRNKRQITISSQFQLYPHKPLYIVFCLFESTVLSGISIDSVLSDFERMGYNTELLNSKLETKGFEKGMSSRRKTFVLHEMLLYKVDPSFPKITPSSFANGTLPDGIVDVSYTVDLSGLPCEPIYQVDDDEIQNH